MPEIAFVVDTQTAFKAFDADVIAELTGKKLVERKFAFDIELMLLSHLRRKGSVGQCGIAWIDSEVRFCLPGGGGRGGRRLGGSHGFSVL